MYLILNSKNKIVEICQNPAYVKLQSNGVVVLSNEYSADAIYSNDTDKFYQTKRTNYINDEHKMVEVENMPENIVAGYWHYWAGEYYTNEQNMKQMAIDKAPEVANLLFVKMAEKGEFEDDVIVAHAEQFPVFPNGINNKGEYVQNQIIMDNENRTLYRVVQETVKPLESQPPHGEGMLAVYRPIEVTHAGTLDDPIPWVYGMDCLEGQYFSYNGHIYKVAVGGNMIPCVWTPDSGIWQWEKIS